ncbi:MAG: FxsA family protein [Rhodobacterales bacterium]|nr:FxsA family protein [Rhodobacterales bacterium]
MRPVILLILWPLVEIALFVTLGARLGLFGTLAVVLGTAVLGVALIRRQGAVTPATLRARMAAGADPGNALADGALIVLAGVLLVLPGFLTDALGGLLLIGPLRRGLLGALARRTLVVRAAGPAPAPGPVIEGEWEEVDPPVRRPASGWTQH